MMNRIESPAALQAAQAQYKAALAKETRRVLICTGTGCLASGGLKCACLWSTQKLGRLSIATAYYMLTHDGAFPQDGETIEGWDEPVISDGEHNIYLTAAGEDYEA